MHNFDNWASPFINSVWTDTNETWNKDEDDWKVVGTNPFRRRSLILSNAVDYEENGIEIFEDAELNNSGNIVSDNYYLVIEFENRRLDIAYLEKGMAIKKNAYVILEADRGEDCGKVINITTKEKYVRLLNKHYDIVSELQPKHIFRLATDNDMELMMRKRKLQRQAMEYCATRVVFYNIDMELIDCEYQWDLNKITFYYISYARVDFRELVKELYSLYKTRIWMCALDKSRNKYLKELLE